MKIAIDARDLQLATTGTKTYLQGLITACKNRSTPTLSIHILDSQFLAGSNTTSSFTKKIRLHFFTFVWKQIVLPFKCWKLGADVLICTDYMLPLLPFGGKKIVVFHDALFFDYPTYYPSPWLIYFKWVAVRAANCSSYIVTTSNFSKNRLLYHFPHWQDKVQVIYQGQKSWATSLALSETGKFIFDRIGTAPFFLHVGSLEKRKNLLFLIRAFATFRKDQHVKLVLVGGSTHKTNSDDSKNITQLIQDLNLEKEVIMAGYLTDEDLSFFYKRACAYLFPSVYEGFGIPILESFHYQLPVAIATGSSLAEVAGDAAIEFDPQDELALVAVMEKLFTDEVIRKELTEKGLNQLNQFNWDIAADQFIELARESLFLRGS